MQGQGQGLTSVV